MQGRVEENELFRRGFGKRDQRFQPHAHSNHMKMLYVIGTKARERDNHTAINPLWQDFPTRCTHAIRSKEDMEKLLKFHANSDDVMIVRYWQTGCTACNALDKAVEYMCHDQAKRTPKLHFFDVQREAVPELTEGMMRFPQVKAFSGGQWADIDFKPPQDFRENVYQAVEREVHERARKGEPVTAVQAEEMYFSIAGPATLQILQDSVTGFYNQAQVRLHNYWKQVSHRRTWYYRKYVADKDVSGNVVPLQTPGDISIFGETTVPTVTSPAAAPAEIPNPDPVSIGVGDGRKFSG